MIKKAHIVLAILLASILLVCIIYIYHCTNIAKSQFSISGNINQQFIEKLNVIPDNAVLRITSNGGDPDIAERAAKIIKEKQIHVFIDSICLSSCAEYLLPAAQTVTISGAGIIGFHQNPLMIDSFRSNQAEYENIQTCYFADNLRYIEKLQKERLGSSGLWKTTLSKLKLEKLNFSKKENCIEVGFKFENAIWLPTSEQLRTIVGLQFNGSSCSDNKYCYESQINKIWPKNTRIVVGDIIYISNGRS